MDENWCKMLSMTQQMLEKKNAMHAVPPPPAATRRHLARCKRLNWPACAPPPTLSLLPSLPQATQQCRRVVLAVGLLRNSTSAHFASPLPRLATASGRWASN